MNIDEDSVDAIRELINIGVGRAAGLLNEMTGTHIRLMVPEVRILRYADLVSENRILEQDRLSAVTLKFEGSFSGISMLVFPPDSAAILITALTGEEIRAPDLDALRIETLNEVGNIVNNAVMGSITNVLNERLTYSMPTYLEGSIAQILGNRRAIDYDWVILAISQFSLADLQVVGTILMIFEIGSLDSLVKRLQDAAGQER
ncbi:MAG: flagellar motor switch protein [Methanoregulaceae archaeon PtaB.Bin009]|jgi:chemotaxis protein CheC|nr:MAG: flagellar motor switch protein [Methanoregulaceae archaeon PtaB.Bin009]HNQ30256.1 chemotaxis protein CheC [Methanolinea sp.]HNS83049.1 chemotaxis protein CheC [Methanolinea sp.]